MSPITAEPTARRSINFPLLIHTGSYFAAKFGGKAIANGRVQQFRWSQLDPSACPAALLLLRRRRVLVPSIGKYHRHPAIPAPVLAQATQGRKWHMRPRDPNILARELRQQLKPRCCSRILVDVENRGDLGMLQLDALCMDGIAPKQDSLSL